MLYHHSTLPYEVGLEQCGEHTRQKFQALLDAGKAQLPHAIEHLQTVPDDTIVRGDLLDIIIDETNRIHMETANDGPSWDVHKNAWQQICGKTGFPLSYAEKIRGTDWGRELVSLNLNTILANEHDKTRYLIRSVRGEARGFLSDRYRRLDMRPIMDRIFGVAANLGAVVIQAVASDVKGEVKFAFPTIFEPIPNEPLLYWVAATASDFGESRVKLTTGWTRAICTNFAVGDTLYSQVHLGKQLPDNIEFSAETYRKDTEFVVSATKDIFEHAFDPKHIQAVCEHIKNANEKDAPKNIGEALRRAGLSKSETEQGTTLYAMPDIEVLPKGDTMWRFSNVVSFLANSAEPDRKLELEAIAGELIQSHKSKQQRLSIAA